MLKNKNLLVIAAAAVIIVVAIVAGVGIYMNRPKTVMQTSVQGLLTEVFEREEFEVVSNLLESGSAEIVMSLSGGENEVSVEYKEYFGLKNKETYVEKIKLSANDFSIDGSMYVGEDYMYVSVPGIYGDPVGISRGKSEKGFESSIFAFESDSDYELPEETADAIKVFCRIYDDAQDKKVVEDIETLLKDYVKLIMDSISEHADIEKENDTVKINGEQVSARVITVEIDAECIYNVMADLHEKLEKDKDIPKLIKKYAKLIDKYVEGTSLEGVIQTELGEDEDDELVDAILEAYDTAIDELGDTLDEMEDSLDEAGSSKIVVELATKKSSSELMAFSVTAKEDGEKMELLDVQIGKAGIKKTDKIKVTVADEMTFQLAVKQNDKKAYKVEFTAEEGDTEMARIYAEIDKEGEEFEFGFEADGECYAIEGDYTKKGKTHTLDFKDVVYTDESGEKVSMINELLGEAEDIELDFELKLIICENDKPKPLAKGKVKSVFEIDEDDIDDIKIAVEEIGAELQGAFELGATEVPAVDYDESSGFGW
jgi:hypothetical protein